VNNFVNKKIIFTITFFLLTKKVSLILIVSIPNKKYNSPDKAKSFVMSEDGKRLLPNVVMLTRIAYEIRARDSI